MNRLAISVGEGRRNARGETVFLTGGVPPAAALAAALVDASKADRESWWSVHVWKDAHRGSERWLGGCGIGIDLDYNDENGKHAAPPIEKAITLEALAREGKLPGSVFHRTPRGARVVFLFDKMLESRDLFQRAARAAGTRVKEAVTAANITGYVVDEKVLLDLGRLLFTPKAKVDGQARDADVIVMRHDPYDPKALAPAASARVFKVVTASTESIQEAIARYNSDNARPIPRNSGDCPMCGHKGCFGQMPGNPQRWACFSDAHAKGGKKGDSCWSGDYLDIDAHAAGVDLIEHLKAKGYLERTTRERSGQPADVTQIGPQEDEPLRSGSYASIVRILREAPLREMVLGTGLLEFNEQTSRVTFNRKPLDEAEVSRIREMCERNIKPPSNKGSGLRFARDLITDAVYQVAHERPFHPIRDYLNSLAWDQVERLDHIPEDVLNIQRTPLIVQMIRKWFIGAVARIMQPGCKMDNALVFVGPGGIGKSTFFSLLAGDDWFCDTPMPIGDKDSYLALHGTWIYEWSEMEAVQRAKSPEIVKAFLSSRVDTFRAPYARSIEPHPRQCVIVGTTNEQDFLTDVTGNRRYWIIELLNEINLALVAKNRDMLWAEAVAAYNSEEPWYLTPAEEDSLRTVHDSHMRRDPWEVKIRGYVYAPDQIKNGVSVAGILTHCIEKPIGNWTQGDENRVAKTLKALGFKRKRVTTAPGTREWRYFPAGKEEA